MRVAIEGCCHGELDRIYQTIQKAEEREGVKVDLLICCGDFQAVRNHGDLTCMAVPVKYRKMQAFYKYYSGESVAPVPTIFVGGNHEATNHLWELSYGGWVAPNIYYLGNAGVVRFGGLRIAGVSGIYKNKDYRKGHFECPPYSEDTKRSAYHVRSCDIFRLKQLTGHLDIFVSHDWPLGIYHHGNTSRLIQTKPYFEQEIASGTLGSPPLMEVLQRLKPDHWFSAHLHVKFAAVYQHEGGGEGEGGRLTKFLALDKCLPRRKFLQILDIPTSSSPPYRLEYDPEWLVVVKTTEPYMRYTQSMWLPPNPLTDDRHTFTPTPAEILHLCQSFAGDLRVPDNFTQTALVYDPTQTTRQYNEVQAIENPQTLQFCQKLGIRNPFKPSASTPPPWPTVPPQNPDEIPLDSDDDTNPPPPRAQPGGSQHHYPWLEDSSGEEGGVSPSHAADMSSFQASTEPGPVTNLDEIALEDSEESDGEVSGGKPREPMLLPTPSSAAQGVSEGGTVEGGEGEGVMVGEEGVMVGGGEGVTVGGGEGEGVTVGRGEGVTVDEADGQKRPKIKRRNIALYGSSSDDL